MNPRDSSHIADHAAALARAWPPLTEDQLERVAFLLKPTPTDGGAAA